MNSPKKSGTKPLIILLLVFLLPVVAAKIVLSMNLYQGGATNKGELLSTGTSYASLAMDNPKPKEWQLLYLLPEHCDQLCLDRLYILQQSHVALGKEQDRVHTLILLDDNSDTSALSGVSFETVKVNPPLSEMLNQQQMIIVDPLGSLVMRYPPVSGRDKQILQAKALISDLRKMLKLSRVG
ncbi:hypothetical protein HWQ46_20685 [Shewanella sp. D64]|uniref:hypothetical protein n=1 Tax=unclassified Shewanella TaxID=196818 RepID=UPI0022BA4FC8|nr:MULTISPECIES: hypothetical protein [unclassified Shewanella]MEC4727956.1 hypothetical protein [Shewanella sp. D64]MEC4740072.1 hypothetical protein [Shewanella sp. E94]WBJ95841.1 hypothetical protein HWQ47_01505 [Shewanella sp. MTB7]